MLSLGPEYSERRRKLYLLLLTLVFIGDIAAIAVKRQQPTEFIPYLVVAVVSSVSLIILWTRRLNVRLVEYLICVSVLLLNVVALYLDLFVAHNHFGDVLLWIVVCYLLAFFVFPPRVALVICGLLFAVKLGLTLYHTNSYGEDWGTFLTVYTSQVVGITLLYLITITNKRHWQEIERLAHTDSLVNQPNRRHLYMLLRSDLERTERQGSSLSLVLFDVDHFKNVNDTYGHLVGDSVLADIARLVAGHIRDTDRFGRWGGEEFLLVLPGTDLAYARLVAERLRRVLADHPFELVGQVTASFGGAAYQPGDTPESLIKRTDDALYRAKQQGRNQVHIAGLQDMTEGTANESV